MGFFSRGIRVIIVLILAIGIAGVLYITKTKPDKKEPEKAYPIAEVLSVKPESIVMRVDAFGTVKPRKLVKLTAEVSGTIEYTNPLFVEGGFLKKNELIFRIDPRSYKLAKDACIVKLRQAKVDIARLEQEIKNLKTDIGLANDNLRLSTKEFNRIKKLSQGNYASKNMLDSSEMKYLQAKMQAQNISNRLSLTDSIMQQKQNVLKMAGVDLEKANLALGKTEIKAPFDGYVMNKFIEQGEFVAMGQPLGNIYLKSKFDVDISIPLEKMRWLSSVMEKGFLPEVEIKLAGSDIKNLHVWSGKVIRVKANIDEKTRTLPMTIEINNIDDNLSPGYKLRPGMFVKCSIQGQKYDNIFILPRHLIKQNSIFLVKNGQLHRQTIGILRKFEEQVYIQSGLQNGDKILSVPIPGAIEGMQVKLK